MTGPGLLEGLLGLPPFGSFGSAAGAGGAAPDAPANLTATAISGSRADLSWDAVTGATGYRLERSSNGVDFIEIIDQAGVTYSNTGLSGVLTFTYRVIAYNAVGDGAASDTAAVVYWQRAVLVQSANLIAYWPLHELSGSVADNVEGTAARDGAYSGVTLNGGAFLDGTPVPLWSGSGGQADLLTASTISAFNAPAGTIVIFAKVSAAGVWADGAVRYIFGLSTSVNSQIYVRKLAAANSLQLRYVAGGVIETASPSTSSTDWLKIAISWNVAGDVVKMYLNDATTPTPLGTLGTWDGAVNALFVGRSPFSATEYWSGTIGHISIYNATLSDATIGVLFGD